MGISRLAVRPSPCYGESLQSYAGRLAEANHISVTHLVGGYYAPVKYRYGTPQLIEVLHEVSGVPVERLQEMVHPAVAGTAGTSTGFLGIRTRGAVVCHQCHGEDGLRLLEWDHPFVTICFYCRGVLAPIDAPERRFVPRDHLRFLLEDVRENALDLDCRPAQERIRLLAQLGRKVAREMTASWPSSRFPDVRAAARRAHAELVEHPSRREVVAAPSLDLALVVIVNCWERTVDADAAHRWLKSRARADRTAEKRRVRSIEEGRAQVEAWTRRVSERGRRTN
jgi:hypothetical protein